MFLLFSEMKNLRLRRDNFTRVLELEAVERGPSHPLFLHANLIKQAIRIFN